MAQRLVARLADGSIHYISHGGTPEDALKRLTGTERRAEWVEVEDGRVRYDSIVGFHILDQDQDEAIGEILRELHARGGGTLDDVREALARRGIETTSPSAVS